MDKKVVKFIILGVVAYAIFAGAVLEFYPQDKNPQNMDWQDREAFNKKQIANLMLESPKQEIVENLGDPDIAEAKITDHGKLHILFYRTQHKKSDGITTPDECTPLLFKNDKLIAWGDIAYEQYKKF